MRKFCIGGADVIDLVMLDSSCVAVDMFNEVVDRPKERLIDDVKATGGDGARFITIDDSELVRMGVAGAVAATVFCCAAILFSLLFFVLGDMNAALLPSLSWPLIESKLLLRSNGLLLPATVDCLV